jgi:hypothetical protein
MRMKMITLCPNTWDLAVKKPNFSLWVRNKLTEEVEKNKDQWEKKWNAPHKEYEIKNNEVKE